MCTTRFLLIKRLIKGLFMFDSDGFDVRNFWWDSRCSKLGTDYTSSDLEVVHG